MDLEKIKKQYEAQEKFRRDRIKEIIKQCREDWISIHKGQDVTKECH